MLENHNYLSDFFFCHLETIILGCIGWLGVDGCLLPSLKARVPSEEPSWMKERELTPAICILSSTHVSWHADTPVYALMLNLHTQVIHKNKIKFFKNDKDPIRVLNSISKVF